jgi:hypothetical protein
LGCCLGYLLRIEPGLWIFSIGLVNLPFFAMEIRHFHCKDMMMIIGEIGPVEVELIYSLIFLASGVYFGGNAFEKTLGDVSGVMSMAWLAGIKVKTVIAVLTFLLELVFTYDNIKDSLEKNAQETVRMLVPVFIMVSLSFLSSYLPSFVNETAVVYFLYQMVFAILILKLMIFNMSGKRFNVIHIQYFYVLLPIITYLLIGVTAQMEAIITRLCMIGALFEFLFTIYRISKQYTNL